MLETKKLCSICHRVAAFSENKEHPFLIHELPHSFFVIGDHQFYHGYSQLLFKEHILKLHELTP